MRRALGVLLGFGALAGGCADAAGEATDVAEIGAIPESTKPCVERSRRRYWPNSTASEHLPLLVHFSAATDEPRAREVLAVLEKSWKREVDEIGFSAPPSDGGACGPDDRFDVFLWRDKVECFVDVLESPRGVLPYMVVDAWGRYATPDQFQSTIAHELNHACQSASTWKASPMIFEATAQAIQEAVVHQPAGYVATFGDPRPTMENAGFQNFPSFSLTHDDHYETWYMYGAALFLWFLDARHFAGDFTYLARLWPRLRAEPDALVALDAELRASGHGGSIADAVVAFAGFRWHVGPGGSARLAPWLDLTAAPRVAEPVVTIDGARMTVDAVSVLDMPNAWASVTARDDRLDLTAEPTGSTYVALRSSKRVAVALAPVRQSESVTWTVQVLPGTNGRDADPVDLAAGPITVDGRTQSLVATALPRALADRRGRATLHLAVRPVD